MSRSKHAIDITQPPEWWVAFQAAAKADGISLSEWLGKAGLASLPKKVRDSLPERTKGRPRLTPEKTS